jgi:hypothetical protein
MHMACGRPPAPIRHPPPRALELRRDGMERSLVMTGGRGASVPADPGWLG